MEKEYHGNIWSENTTWPQSQHKNYIRIITCNFGFIKLSYFLTDCSALHHVYHIISLSDVQVIIANIIQSGRLSDRLTRECESFLIFTRDWRLVLLVIIQYLRHFNIPFHHMTDLVAGPGRTISHVRFWSGAWEDWLEVTTTSLARAATIWREENKSSTIGGVVVVVVVVV